MNYKNMFFAAIAAIVLLAGLVIYQFQQIGQLRQELAALSKAVPIQIAATGPMTGQYASFGEQFRRGAEMAVKDINAAGGVLGQKVKLLIMDDACDPKQAVAVANKAVSDGVVFVADSQIDRMEANIEAMQNLYDNMSEHGYDLTTIPFVIQYNKRDLPNAASINDLQASLNPGWPVEEPSKMRPMPDPQHEGEFLIQQIEGQWIERVGYYEAVALNGDGVFDTLKALSKLVIQNLG